LLPARAEKSAPDSVTCSLPDEASYQVAATFSSYYGEILPPGKESDMRRSCWLFMMSATAVLGQNARTGPAVGQPVPDFSLQDQKGGTQTLKSVSGPRGKMLVFFRSADW